MPGESVSEEERRGLLQALEEAREGAERVRFIVAGSQDARARG